MKKIKKIPALPCNRSLKRNKKQQLFGCAWNVAIEWVYSSYWSFRFWKRMKWLYAKWPDVSYFYQGCGRTSESQHAIKHYETPRSDPHCLVISLDNWSVWWARVCCCGVLISVQCVNNSVLIVPFFHMLPNLQVLLVWWWSPVLENRTTGSAGDQPAKTNLCRSHKQAAEK